MRFVVEHIVDKCSENGLLPAEDRDIYVFGGICLVKSALNMLFPLVLSAIFGHFLQMALFLALYCALRRFAGGFHAQSERLCALLSQLMVLGVFFLFLFYSLIPPTVLGILSAASAGAIVLAAPVEVVDNPLNAAEKKVYRTKAIALTLLCMGGYIVCLVLGLAFAASFAGAVLVVELLMLQELVRKKVFSGFGTAGHCP